MASRISTVSAAAAVAVGTAFLAWSIPYVTGNPSLLSFAPDFPIRDYPFSNPFLRMVTTPEPAEDYLCRSQSYQTEIISLDPLLIYIRNFMNPGDITALLSTAESRFERSEVIKAGRELRTADRTSSSAGLPRDDPAVVCVINRARSFLGTMLSDGWDEMGPSQLVRYTAGQRFNIHRDWYDTPRWANDGTNRKWNRVASIFVVLQDNCTGGETHFPRVTAVSKQLGRERAQDAPDAADWKWTRDDPVWRNHEEGGLAFRPVAGNAIFWVNLHANGTGDYRVAHAGLPVGDGLKTAMNIWPRQYYASE